MTSPRSRTPHVEFDAGGCDRGLAPFPDAGRRAAPPQAGTAAALTTRAVTLRASSVSPCLRVGSDKRRHLTAVERKLLTMKSPALDAAAEQLLRELAPQVLGATLRRYGDFSAAEDA